MNCERLNSLLDAERELTPTERQAVDEHFASCASCREAWEAYGELSALRVPPTPKDLRTRITAALVARPVSTARGMRRGFVVGAVLVLGAAAATTIALRFDTAPEPAPVVETVAPPPVTTSTPAPSEAVPAAEDRAAGATLPERLEPSDAAAPVGYPLDPHSVVVIAVPDPAADAEVAAALARCHEAVVEQLRGVDGLNIIAGDRVLPYAESSLSEAEVARTLGAGVAADDPGLRARAWGLLTDVSDSDFKPVLLADLAQHPVENVRAAAAAGLRQQRDEPDVREALERALGDPSTIVQRAARSSLDGIGL